MASDRSIKTASARLVAVHRVKVPPTESLSPAAKGLGPADQHDDPLLREGLRKRHSLRL